jgi:hypothetical protein
MGLGIGWGVVTVVVPVERRAERTMGRLVVGTGNVEVAGMMVARSRRSFVLAEVGEAESEAALVRGWRWLGGRAAVAAPRW